MKLDYVNNDPEALYVEHDMLMTVVSGYTAGQAYNELCAMMGGRWPDAVIQEEAPFAHNFFMKLFGVIPNE